MRGRESAAWATGRPSSNKPSLMLTTQLDLLGAQEEETLSKELENAAFCLSTLRELLTISDNSFSWGPVRRVK